MGFSSLLWNWWLHLVKIISGAPFINTNWCRLSPGLSVTAKAHLLALLNGMSKICKAQVIENHVFTAGHRSTRGKSAQLAKELGMNAY